MIRRRDLPVLLPVFTTCGGRPEKPIHIAVGTALVESYLVQLAQELGYFREEGIKVEIDNLAGARQAESLLAGSSDATYQTFGFVLQFAAEGRSLRSFFVGADTLSAMLVVAEHKATHIHHVEDLRGATVGVTNFGSAQHSFLEYILFRHGLMPTDLKLVAYGSGPSAIASLQHGKVDAGMINGSAFTILKRRAPGVRILKDPRTRQATKELTGVDSLPNFCLISTVQWLEQNPALARKLTKAMVRTVRWVHSHKPEEVRERLPASLRTQDKDGDLETLRILMDGTSKDGRMPPEAPAGVLRYAGVTNEKVRNAKIDLSATYTNQFIEEANR